MNPDNSSRLSPAQWRSGLAAWLGWLFDGLDMHLYTLVAVPFVAMLLAQAPGSPEVAEKTGWIQASFLIGWAVGGAFFGRLGDLIGRSRALSLTVLTYAVFTGLSFFAGEWWHLLIFRFLAALGIGGEWAVGSTLLAETWPKRWRPWTAAVLQTGVNLGIMLACLAGLLLQDQKPNVIFLVGIIPAVLVWWIRRHVPETGEWAQAREKLERPPGIADLFAAGVRKTTVVAAVVCACSLTAWWAFIFWHAQYLRALARASGMEAAQVNGMVARTFALVVGVSIAGNFVAGALARYLGYRAAISGMFVGAAATMLVAFGQERSVESLATFWLPAVGFWSGVFGLFTMFLPPLFPTLVRTTGAGFCYNIGRVAAAVGTIYAAKITGGGDFRGTLWMDAFLFLPPALLVWWLVSASGEEESA